MEREPYDEEQRAREARRECGMPGGGQGRRDEPGRSGVYPVSHSEGASPEAPLRGESEWGQGELGAAGYEESGNSGLNLGLDREAGLLPAGDEGTTAAQSEP
jgi:hypothetical protein